jgi:hypothetical protein
VPPFARSATIHGRRREILDDAQNRSQIARQCALATIWEPDATTRDYVSEVSSSKIDITGAIYY